MTKYSYVGNYLSNSDGQISEYSDINPRRGNGKPSELITAAPLNGERAIPTGDYAKYYQRQDIKQPTRDGLAASPG
jgi:hypothetical protein